MCLQRLDTDQVWWRPGDASNSVGNLVLHLCGNARQWILHGILGRADARNRPAEFEARGGKTGPELITHLEGEMRGVVEGLDELEQIVVADADYLLGARVIQGIDTTALRALYHVVEHYAQHTGQIIWVTKQVVDADLGFWQVEGGVARPTW